MMLLENIALAVLIIFVLVVLSALFSGSETAFTAASARNYLLAKRGNRQAKIFLKLRARMDHVIAAILLGNNFVNILASSIATSVLIGMFGTIGVVYATFIMTGIILIFAEILPKIIAVRHADWLALRLSPFLRILLFLLLPFLLCLQALLWLVSRPFGGNLMQNIAPGEHTEILRGAIEMHDEAVSSPDERKMLHSILDLEQIHIAAVMTHRRDVEVIDLQQTPTAIIDQAAQSPYSRFPLTDGDPEIIIGVIHAKQLMSEYRKRKGKMRRKDISAIASKPWFVPENMSLKDQLKYFQERREHFSLAVDEYGVFLGIVTLEDVLEEIVGNIDDERDKEFIGVTSKGSYYIVEGNVTIRDLNRELGWVLPDEYAVTIAGLVMHEARTIPKKNQIFAFHGYRFKILKMDKTRIASLQITPLKSEKK